jgi:hypothetical protein
MCLDVFLVIQWCVPVPTRIIVSVCDVCVYAHVLAFP